MTISQIQKKLDQVQQILVKESMACLHGTNGKCAHDTEKVSEIVTEVQNELEELRLTVMSMHTQITDFRAELTTLGGSR